jgi:glycerol kinase
LFLRLFDIPPAILPEIRDSGGSFGTTDVLGAKIPIAGVIADQQAALFGEGCFTPGDVKCTHGTGTFLDMNVGNRPAASLHGLLPMIAWKIKDETVFMLEGFIPATGALMAWLKDGLGLIEDVANSERLAKSVPDSGGVVAVPALMGLGAPYWDPRVRGAVLGMTLSTKKAHLVRAFLEGIALECRDILLAMEKDAKLKVRMLISDGGASKNDFLLEGLAGTLGLEIQRPEMLEATALGAAFLAGLAVKFWGSKEELLKLRRIERSFPPAMDPKTRLAMAKDWHWALKHLRALAKHNRG